MSASRSLRANIGLTQEAFERLLRWLDPDREQAGERYEQIRFKLIKIFQSRGCLISEELADETFNRVAGKVQEIAETYRGDPALYFYGVAKMIYLEHLRKPVPDLVETAHTSGEDEEQYECLEQCLQRLKDKNRELIMIYYSEEKQGKIDHRKELARRMGMEPNALWVRMHRMRETLRNCVSECLKQKRWK